MKIKKKPHSGYKEWINGKYKEALPLIQNAADGGDVAARTLLGQMYMLGQGTKKNMILAAKNLKIAAKKGDSGGQYLYAMVLEDGKGITQNVREAFHWYLRSMDQGNRLAPSRVLALLRKHPEFKQVCKKLNIYPAMIYPDGSKEILM